jgi:hypothetical protein
VIALRKYDPVQVDLLESRLDSYEQKQANSFIRTSFLKERELRHPLNGRMQIEDESRKVLLSPYPKDLKTGKAELVDYVIAELYQSIPQLKSSKADMEIKADLYGDPVKLNLQVFEEDSVPVTKEEKEGNEEAIPCVSVKFQAERTRNKETEKLEGEITSEFYKETKAKWESRMTELQLELAAIARAEPTSIDNAMRILELTATAHVRFKNADSAQKRELLRRVLSNSVWRDGKLEVELKDVFDLMLKTVIAVIPESASEDEQKLFLVKSVDWWRQGDSNP